MTTKTIEQYNDYLSLFSINRDLNIPLTQVNLNEVGITEYLDRECYCIDLNGLSPFVTLNKIKMEHIFKACFNVLSNNDITIYQDNELVEIFFCFEERNLQQEFLNELNNLTDYEFKEFDSVLNAMSVQNYFVPLGDQIPLTTFLRVYSSLLDKAKLLKESL